jgi:chromosome segregation protein
MQFAKLRLAGFKSFVEPTEFVIEEGLTGIVGPNGCGKSNLVEALRWVMGENRVKQMRGGEMDDVIFAGTSSRPARDVAEVAVLIANDQRKAPPGWNDMTEIEVSRRIERGEGSAYRIGGKESRARDVQLFFADIASGAHSPALVSQGRISAIINAKPSERRQILEEAAGITGLHARRHEADLKLRAAEQNLARLDDVITTLDQQFQALKKQAKQAERYRNLDGLIRRAEAILLTLRWREADAADRTAAERFATAEQRVAEATQRVAVASTAVAETAAVLPDLRRAEAEAAAKTTRLETQAQAIEAEERRVAAALADLTRRLTQLAEDQARETARRQDATAALETLAQERAALEEAAASAQAIAAETATALERQRGIVAEREEVVTRATGAVAAAEAERNAVQRQLADAERRLTDARLRITGAENDLAGLSRAAIPAERRQDAEDRVAAAEAAIEAAQQRVDAAEAARRAAQEEERGARAALGTIESEIAKLDGEINALRRLLADGGAGDLFAPVIDQIRVAPGYETALGAALGDDLTAPLDSTAPTHWRMGGDATEDPALPAGIESLALHVQAPPALARRLAQIGLVDLDQAPDIATARCGGGTASRCARAHRRPPPPGWRSATASPNYSRGAPRRARSWTARAAGCRPLARARQPPARPSVPPARPPVNRSPPSMPRGRPRRGWRAKAPSRRRASPPSRSGWSASSRSVARRRSAGTASRRASASCRRSNRSGVPWGSSAPRCRPSATG